MGSRCYKKYQNEDPVGYNIRRKLCVHVQGQLEN